MVPPPITTPLHSSADILNARFRRRPYGATSTASWPSDGRLADAGVLVHTFDGWEDASNDRKFSPGPGIRLVSASLIYAAQSEGSRTIPTYGGQSPTAIVFRPEYTRVVCGCARDCGARCIGAYGSPSSEPVYCDPTQQSYTWTNCVWQPGPSLGVMLEQGAGASAYNEMIVDAVHWSARLPEAVEAIIGDPGAHQALMNAFPDLSPNDVPLLRLNVDDWFAPFGDW